MTRVPLRMIAGASPAGRGSTTGRSEDGGQAACPSDERETVPTLKRVEQRFGPDVLVEVDPH